MCITDTKKRRLSLDKEDLVQKWIKYGHENSSQNPERVSVSDRCSTNSSKIMEEIGKINEPATTSGAAPTLESVQQYDDETHNLDRGN